MKDEEFLEDFQDEFETVTMTDEDGVEIDFVIIDHVASGVDRYLLVIEAANMDDEEAEAEILKEVSINAQEVTYELVDDDEEFDRIAALFAQNDGEYDVQIDN